MAAYNAREYLMQANTEKPPVLTPPREEGGVRALLLLGMAALCGVISLAASVFVQS